jgi:hypothetical protein
MPLGIHVETFEIRFESNGILFIDERVGIAKDAMQFRFR